MKTNNDFAFILETFFNKHLSLERKFSDNTFNTYLMVIKQYINYLDQQGIKAKDITINNFDKQTILKFLDYVEKDLNCSPKTRNHKLTIINSFLEYAQSLNPVYLRRYLDSKSIKYKKAIHKKMDYMSIDELNVFMSIINLKYKSGYKHFVLFTVLYETATRVSELINIKVDDLFLIGDSPYIKVLGKGNKERIIFISDTLVEMINEYKDKFKIKEGYLFLNNSNRQYTRFAINKLIDKYKTLAIEKCPTLKRKTITPHTFRHSKAVHFLENGVALPTIQRFLGHSNIQTTEIYLDITKEIVSKAIETSRDLIKTSKDEAIWQNNNELIELLESIK